VGDVGIGDNSPNAKLHISNGTSGGSYNPNAIQVIEDNASGYLQFTTPSNTENGILSSSDVSTLRSGIIFRPDSSVQIRAGGNNTKLFVNKNGDVGIGTLAPGARLDINGSAIIGVNGNVLTEIIKTTVTKNVASIAANSTLEVDFSVSNAALTSTVYISPQNDLTSGLILAYARVNAAGVVRVKFTNVTGAAIDPPSMDYYITVIR
jgi:hypothetical protein